MSDTSASVNAANDPQPFLPYSPSKGSLYALPVLKQLLMSRSRYSLANCSR